MSLLKSFTDQIFNISNIVNQNTDTEPIKANETNRKIHSKINIESANCILFDIPQCSTGSLFSANFILFINSIASIKVNSVKVELVQHTIIQPSLSPTCKFCKKSLGSIKKIKEWDLLSKPTILRNGQFNAPLSCHLEGYLPASTKVGPTQQTRISYELLTTIKYVSADKDRIYTDTMPFQISRIFRDNRPKLSHRTFEPSTTILESYLPDTIFVNTKNSVKIIIKNLNKDIPSRRWSIKNIECFLFEIIQYESTYCGEHDQGQLFKKLIKQTKEVDKQSIFEKIHPNKTSISSFFEANDVNEIDEIDQNEDRKVITEQSYQISNVDIDYNKISQRFLENNDIEATFKIDHSGLTGTNYATDLELDNMSVKHKVIMQITLFEEEISYERVPYRKPISISSNTAVTNTTNSEKCLIENIQDEDMSCPNTINVIEDKDPDTPEPKQMKRLCADRTGKMQKLKTTFKLILSETPQNDCQLPWEEDIPPIYESVQDVGGSPPTYVAA